MLSIVTPCLFALLDSSSAAVLPWLAGCGSQQAGATSGGTTTGQSAKSTDRDRLLAAVRPSRGRGCGRERRPWCSRGRAIKPYDKTFDDLRFEMTADAEFHRSMLTKQIEAMAGQRIRIRGYILPTPQKNGITTFVLVRDNQECCFGPGAALYDCILVDMRKGKTAEFSIRPVAAEGIFDIRELVIGGKHLAIYHLDAESVGGS